MSEPRDPRQSPQAGDLFRKFGVLVQVTRVHQGCVYTTTDLSVRGWLGIQGFRAWAKDAEVVTEVTQ
jgi:hypothetical protein